jgi:hypothetical protein
LVIGSLSKPPDNLPVWIGTPELAKTVRQILTQHVI